MTINSEMLTDEIKSYYHDLLYYIGSLIELSAIPKAHENDSSYLLSNLVQINGYSVILSAKTNFLTYLTSTSEELPQKEIPIHRTVKRVVHGSRRLASTFKKKINVKLEGKSYATIYGPDVFEFIPYTLLENAIKYSPNGGSVFISIIEDAEEILCKFVSTGPEIQTDEFSRIGEQAFRGTYAQQATSKGLGMGLYHAKRALETLYSGRLKVSQRLVGPPIMFQSIPYRETTFEIRLPR